MSVANNDKLSKEEKHKLRIARKEAKLKEKLEALQKAADKQRKIDEKFMKQALKLANKAAEMNEVPIGCVIVHEGKVIARGYNRRTVDKSTLAHAEITAIKKASKKLEDWRLENCTLYVTLEPCQMCAGAIVQARIPRCVIGCMNPKAGCAGSIINILDMKEFNHRVEVKNGILEKECSAIMKEFFHKLRKTKQEKGQNSFI